MPMLIVNLILPPSYYDVNLSTDKKQILLMKEDVILTAIQEIFRCAIDASNTSLHVSSVIGKGKKEARREVASSLQSQRMAAITPSVQREVNSLFRSPSSQARAREQTPSQIQSQTRSEGREQSREEGQVKEQARVEERVREKPPVREQSQLHSQVREKPPVKEQPQGKEQGREQGKEQGREQGKEQPHSILNEIKEPISVVVDRCRKSKKRHDPLLLSPIKKACDSPVSQPSAKPSPLHSVFTRTASNDLSQSTNVSRTSILQEFQSLVNRVPSLLTISSTPLFPDPQGFLSSDFAGDAIPSQASAEQELTCILQKVCFLLCGND